VPVWCGGARRRNLRALEQVETLVKVSGAGDLDVLAFPRALGGNPIVIVRASGSTATIVKPSCSKAAMILRAIARR
jgi:hypothetical protein